MHKGAGKPDAATSAGPAADSLKGLQIGSLIGIHELGNMHKATD